MLHFSVCMQHEVSSNSLLDDSQHARQLQLFGTHSRNFVAPSISTYANGTTSLVGDPTFGKNGLIPNFLTSIGGAAPSNPFVGSIFLHVSSTFVARF
jgi:hypothetical protein